MIASDFVTEYLEPVIWNRLHIILAPFYKKSSPLHIYKNRDGKYSAVDNRNQHKEKLERQMQSGELTAESILNYFPEYTSVIFYTPEGIRNYYTKVQEKKYTKWDIDSYLLMLQREIRDTKGIIVYERNHTKGFMEWLNNNITCKNAIYLLWISEEEKEYFFNCILRIQNGKINLVTTAERYSKVPITYDMCCECIRREFKIQIMPYRFTLQEWQQFVSV